MDLERYKPIREGVRLDGVDGALDVWQITGANLSHGDVCEIYGFLKEEVFGEDDPDDKKEDFQRQMDQKIADPAGSLGKLYNLYDRTLIHLVTDAQKKLAGVLFGTLRDTGWFFSENDVNIGSANFEKEYGVDEYIFYSLLAVRRDLRGAGVFKDIIAPRAQSVVNCRKRLKEGVLEVLTVKPWDQNSKEVLLKNGFEDFDEGHLLTRLPNRLPHLKRWSPHEENKY